MGFKRRTLRQSCPGGPRWPPPQLNTFETQTTVTAVWLADRCHANCHAPLLSLSPYCPSHVSHGSRQALNQVVFGRRAELEVRVPCPRTAPRARRVRRGAGSLPEHRAFKRSGRRELRVAWEEPPCTACAAVADAQAVGGVGRCAARGRLRAARLPSRRLRGPRARPPDGDEHRALVLAQLVHVRVGECDLVDEVVHLVRALHVRVEPRRGETQGLWARRGHGWACCRPRQGSGSPASGKGAAGWGRRVREQHAVGHPYPRLAREGGTWQERHKGTHHVLKE